MADTTAQEQANQHAISQGSAFVWHEVYVPDLDKAKDFYGKVLGWTSQSMPMGEMGDYHMLCRNGQPVCGMWATVGEHANVPPHWATYIFVEDVDKACETATANGGNIHVPAMNVPTVGRMALIQDPQGAHFWVFTPDPNSGG